MCSTLIVRFGLSKFIIKKGDTFSGVVDLYQNRSHLRPENADSFQLRSAVSNLKNTFSENITLTKVSSGKYRFAVQTSTWPIETLTWDIQIDCENQSISVPYETNLYIEVRSGVTQ